MRHLTTRRRVRGMTLVELMVGLAIAAVLLTAAAPSFTEYIQNSRLRENGNLLYSQALFAQSEAIKRNTVIRLATSGSTVQVIDLTVAAEPVTLFTRQFSDGISAATGTVDFTGEGRPLDFTPGSINLSSSSTTCSTVIRCPGLRVDGGGGIRLCGDYNTNCD